VACTFGKLDATLVEPVVLDTGEALRVLELAEQAVLQQGAVCGVQGRAVEHAATADVADPHQHMAAAKRMQCVDELAAVRDDRARRHGQAVLHAGLWMHDLLAGRSGGNIGISTQGRPCSGVKPP